MPVSARVSIEIARGSTGTPASVQRVRDAVGEQRVDAGPGGEDLARPRRRAPPGSRSRAASTSRRISRSTRANAPKPGMQQRSGRSLRALTLQVSRRRASGSEERLRDVALAGVGHDHDDPLARATPGARPDLQRRRTAPRRRRCPASTPARRAHVQAVWIASSSETAITSSSSSRLSTGGTKPAPMPWIRCGPGAPPERTAEPAGSTATTRSSGLRARAGTRRRR